MADPRSASFVEGSSGYADARSAPRWFFALWPDRAVRTALTAQAAGLIPAVLPAGSRLTHPADLHLTLAYMGPLDADVLRFAERAADQVRACRFDLDIDRIGHFGHAGVIWCGPSVSPEPMKVLVADLRMRLSDSGLIADARPYCPHLTLARRAGVKVDARWPNAIPWSVGDFVLAAGRGGATPRYWIRRRWPLAAC